MKQIKILSLLIIITAFLGLSIQKVNSQSASYIKAQTPAAAQNTQQYTLVSALSIVANPARYINRNIKIKAKFDKFSTLGLDYAPALRSSEEYITFLIQRPDTNHNIPLSELKIFLKKDIAEKNIDLDEGDEIEFTGRVFSAALGDAWMDVDKFTVLTHKQKDQKKTETTTK